MTPGGNVTKAKEYRKYTNQQIHETLTLRHDVTFTLRLAVTSHTHGDWVLFWTYTWRLGVILDIHMENGCYYGRALLGAFYGTVVAKGAWLYGRCCVPPDASTYHCLPAYTDIVCVPLLPLYAIAVVGRSVVLMSEMMGDQRLACATIQQQ